MSERQDTLVRALIVAFGAGTDDLGELFTDDAEVWSPNMYATSLAEVTEAFGDREEAFSNQAVTVRSIDEIGNKVVAEWRLDADHTGRLMFDDENWIDATGAHVYMGGVSIAEYSGDKIRAVRTYFDDLAFLEQLIG
jgi:ketosteroid isomerase-like protein